ncbi:coat protein [Ononis yellow mosaic virus]|uniref:Capsid protein n=1 Tax=Ononis yellow mosaic virus TaxID=12153 RepID=CAPSD_OYMV|nr:coat protein [Ononis yellow mosaic virus]P20124.1 RecName: Full=Coat protein; AltName: Full=Virion protein [Ononis yellow mosaic virus]AAA46797.1 virion protein (VP) [Ononis yellow mosaic virus]
MEDSQPIKVRQPSISAPGTHLSPNPGQQSPSMVVPFQVSVSDLGVSEVSAQITLSSDPTLAQLTSIYRMASIVECEAVLFPNSTSSKNPVHCDLIWVPSNSSASPKTILQTYGGNRFTVGGPITSNQIISFPLRLDSVNPIIKDSVLYLDSPRLLAFSPAPPETQSIPSASLLIRGKLRLSSILVQPLLTSS